MLVSKQPVSSLMSIQMFGGANSAVQSDVSEVLYQRRRSTHLQHVADIKDGAVFSGVHVWHDVAVFVLDGHAPAGKLHHLPTLGPVEVKQGRLLMGTLEWIGRHDYFLHLAYFFL